MEAIKDKKLLESEFELLNKISTVISKGNSEECAKIINVHYKKSELNGLWVYNIKDSMSEHFEYIKSMKIETISEQKRVKFQFEVPEKSQYHGQAYDVEIDIPKSYPEFEPLECYLKQRVYHMNVEQTRDTQDRY